MRARIIKVDGSTEQIDIPQNSGEQLNAMYKLLDCSLVEVIRLVEQAPGRAGVDMWIDDEGLFSKKPNYIATELAITITGRPILYYIAGDVLVTGGADSEGDALGLTEMQDDVLASMIPRIAAHVMAGV